MRNAFAIFIFLFSSLICKADYARIPLPQLIEMSDLIVEGKIIHVSILNVKIEISEVIKGNLKKKKILVSKFSNWQCASRWAKYKKGQTELFFLVKNDLRTAWRAIGIGNEGELPIENGFIYYQTRYMGIDSTRHKFKLMDGFYYGNKFPVDDAKASISYYIDHKEEITTAIEKGNYTTNYIFLKRIVEELMVLRSYTEN